MTTINLTTATYEGQNTASAPITKYIAVVNRTSGFVHALETDADTYRPSYGIEVDRIEYPAELGIVPQIGQPAPPLN